MSDFLGPGSVVLLIAAGFFVMFFFLKGTDPDIAQGTGPGAQQGSIFLGWEYFCGFVIAVFVNAGFVIPAARAMPDALSVLGVLASLPPPTHRGFYALHRWRQLISSRAAGNAVLTRPFTLLLRSFIDDDFVFEEGSESTQLDEGLSRALWRYGMFASVGRPGQTAKEFSGCLGLALDGETDWHKQVLGLMDFADRVVMTVGVSSGLRWELSQFNDSRLAKLTLILLPQDSEGRLATRRKFTAGSAQFSNLAIERIKDAIAARFRSDGSPIFIVARTDSQMTYHVARLLSLLPVERLSGLIRRSANP